jgi:hypothetical protein
MEWNKIHSQITTYFTMNHFTGTNLDQFDFFIPFLCQLKQTFTTHLLHSFSILFKLNGKRFQQEAVKVVKSAAIQKSKKKFYFFNRNLFIICKK